LKLYGSYSAKRALRPGRNIGFWLCFSRVIGETADAAATETMKNQRSKDIENGLGYEKCPPPLYSSLMRDRGLQRERDGDDGEAGRLRMPVTVAAVFVAFLLMCGFFSGVMYERMVIFTRCAVCRLDF
jgi:hypothetical protein